VTDAPGPAIVVQDHANGTDQIGVIEDADGAQNQHQKIVMPPVTDLRRRRQDLSRAMIHAHQSENNGSNEVALGTDAHRMMINA